MAGDVLGGRRLPLFDGPTPVRERHVVMFSAGIGSWAAAKRVASEHGTENLALLFTDTLIEDDDTYRFLIEGAGNVMGVDVVPPTLDQFPGVREPVERALFLRGLAATMMEAVPGLVWIADGRTPWQVFDDLGAVGTSHSGICSRVLKREVSDRWLAANCDPTMTTVYLGIDWSEEHRFDDGKGYGARHRYASLGWNCLAPLTGAPYLTKAQMLAAAEAEGLRPGRAYALGLAHDNCGGGCTRAGIGHYAHLLRVRPDRYAYTEDEEQRFLERHPSGHTILRDRRGGATKPLSLKDLRGRIERGADVDKFEIGGCGCFIADGAA